MSNKVTINGVEVSTDHYINGQRISSEKKFSVINPNNPSEILAEVSRGDETTAKFAVSSARNGFNVWSEMTVDERSLIMHKLADLIDSHVDDISLIECLDMGMRHESLRNRVIPRGARNFRSYADIAKEYKPRKWHSNTTENEIQRMPSGVSVIITPWNAPFMLSTWKCAPALAAGNSVILKPAEWSPLSASLLGDLIDEAGFPPGVFNIVQGIGEEVGAALVSNPNVNRVSFTGSPEAARYIGKSAAENIIPFTGELGGKSPLIIFPDADFDAAVKKAVGQFDDSGQVCLAGTRLLVHSSIKEKFLKRFLELTAEQKLGPSFDDSTEITPMIHPDHLKNVNDFVSRAKINGDKILCGGNIYKKGHLWFEPTLIEPLSNESEVIQKEIFGPVLTLQTFNDESEAVELANSTKYGLSGMVYTSNKATAQRVGRAVRAGTVWVNCFLIRDLTAPFGGFGISGIGREGGDYGIDFHSDLKTFQVLDNSLTD
jgi:betaine-aldehyde dehydrogenase/5-carboxymethyl-2-hydroxymuconic-semialdehyde dehydrogenase